VQSAASAVSFFDTLNNTAMTNAGLQHIDYYETTNSTGSGSLTGIIQGNTMTGCQGGGLGTCDGMTINKAGAGSLSLRIQSNTVDGITRNGIDVGVDGTGSSNFSVISNTIKNPADTSAVNAQGSAMLFDAGATTGSTVNWCLNVTGNHINNSGLWDINGFGTDIFMQANHNAVVNLPGLAPAAGATTAQIAAFISTNNDLSPAAGNPTVTARKLGASTYVGGAACTVP
jgi:hypothetical protein